MRICLALLLLLLTQSAFAQEIFEAVRAGDSTLVARLLEQEADLANQFDDRHCSPIHYAASRDNLAIVNQLLAGGADFDAVDADGETPLHWASYMGRTEVAQLLISLGADIAIVSSGGVTPLHYSINQGHEEVTKLLVDHGVDITVADANQLTPLWLAVRRGNVSMVETLLAAGADVNVVIADGSGLLSQAALSNQAAIADLLIGKGIDLNLKNDRGLGPLHLAVVCGSEEFTRLMIQKQANLEVKTLDGTTPLALARAAGHGTIEELLLSGGAENIDPPFPGFSGPYLGMQAPGRTPVSFLNEITTFVYRPHGGVTVSKDNDELYWVRNCPGFQKIWYTREVNGQWSRPAIAAFNSTVGGVGDEDPCVSPDGKKLFFTSNRPLHPGEPARSVQGIWFVDRTAEGWSEPQMVEIPGRKPDWDIGGATVSEDGSIYFHITYVEQGRRIADIYSMSLEDNQYGDLTRLSDAVNSPSIEAKPYVAPDGSYLIFTSHGPEDGIMISTREPNGLWAEAVCISSLLGDHITSLQGISPDGKYLFLNGKKDGLPGFYWVDASVLESHK